jgi:carboxylate-amine ligase
MTQFGVEEEFFLLDPVSLAPSGSGHRTARALTDSHGPGDITSEFLTCQIEHSSAPAETIADMERQLRRARTAIAQQAAAEGVILGPVGTPYADGDAQISPSGRYRTIAKWLADISGGHHVCGLHIHVEIDDVEARVQALNRLRPWLPVLLSMAGNSPFWHSRVTGFQSWRSILMRRLPTMGCPPAFRDHDHYESHRDHLIRVGAAPDAASLSWTARLSERYPTVELRVFDAQLDVQDTLLLATVARALLRTDLPLAVQLDTDLIDAMLWMAAREGLNTAVIDPTSGQASTARLLVQALLVLLEPALTETGDFEFVQDAFGRLRTEGTGADRQLDALRNKGLVGLSALMTRSARLPSGHASA